jgi:hypothetical protein
MTAGSRADAITATPFSMSAVLQRRISVLSSPSWVFGPAGVILNVWPGIVIDILLDDAINAWRVGDRQLEVEGGGRPGHRHDQDKSTYD